MALPKSIDPCPIIEAVAEIRFDPNVPKEAVFGILYSVVKDKYNKFEELPILQLPGNILNHDPKLIFKPHYKLKKDNYVLQIGPRVFSLSVSPPYSGWGEFSQKLKDFIDDINSSEVVKKVLRLGIRYINFFENKNIFNDITLKIHKIEQQIINDQMFFYTILQEGKFFCDLKIQSADKITIETIEKKGSILDLDIFIDKGEIPVLDPNESLLNEGHEFGKKIFYELLEQKFLETLNPIY